MLFLRAAQEDGRRACRSARRRDRARSVNDEFGDVDSVLYTIIGDGASYAQLKEVAEAFRKRLQRAADVTKVDLYGDQPERIFVEFSHAKLATLGVPLQAVFDSIAKQNALSSAGEFQTDAQRLPVRVTGAQQGAEAVAETPVFAGGQTFRLGDVANVTHGYEDPPSFLIRAQGQPALEVGVVMQKGGNILALGKALDATLAEFETELPRGVTISRIADQPEVVDRAVVRIHPLLRRGAGDRARGRVSCRSAGAPASSSRPRSRWCWRSCSSRWRSWASTCSG